MRAGDGHLAPCESQPEQMIQCDVGKVRVQQPQPQLPTDLGQRASVPKDARPQFLAALIGVFLAYSGPAVFIGLAGTFLATAVHDSRSRCPA